jgi:hypothetical protein
MFGCRFALRLRRPDVAATLVPRRLLLLQLSKQPDAASATGWLNLLCLSGEANQILALPAELREERIQPLFSLQSVFRVVQEDK